MAREYEAAKDVDVFRRYGMLKRLIKRTVMHLRLHQNSGSAEDQNSTACTAVSGKTRTCREELRKRNDHVNSTCCLSAVHTARQCRHWRHLANTIERSMRGGYAALRRITRLLVVPDSMRSSVYETVRRPSVCPSIPLFVHSRAYSKRVFRTNCALRIKKCAPLISSGIYFLSTS